MLLKKNIILLFIIFIVIIPGFSHEKDEIEDKLYELMTSEEYQYIEEDQLNEKEKKPNRLLEFIQKYLSLPLIIIFAIVLLVLLGIIIFIIIKNFALKKAGRKGLNKFKNKPLVTNHFSFDYKKELERAKHLLKEKKYKEAIQVLLNSLWLYFSYINVIKYIKSKTNREYLRALKDNPYYPKLNNIIVLSEKTVYRGDVINEPECEKLFNTVEEFIFQ